MSHSLYYLHQTAIASNDFIGHDLYKALSLYITFHFCCLNPFLHSPFGFFPSFNCFQFQNVWRGQIILVLSPAQCIGRRLGSIPTISFLNAPSILVSRYRQDQFWSICEDRYINMSLFSPQHNEKYQITYFNTHLLDFKTGNYYVCKDLTWTYVSLQNYLPFLLSFIPITQLLCSAMESTYPHPCTKYNMIPHS